MGTVYFCGSHGSADRIYGEISSADWERVTQETMKLMNKANVEAQIIQEERGESWFNTLTLEQQNFLYEKIGKAIVNSQKESMPWVLSTFLTDLSKCLQIRYCFFLKKYCVLKKMML